jgi:hypothetical protein
VAKAKTSSWFLSVGSEGDGEVSVDIFGRIRFEFASSAFVQSRGTLHYGGQASGQEEVAVGWLV